MIAPSIIQPLIYQIGESSGPEILIALTGITTFPRPLDILRLFSPGEVSISHCQEQRE